MAQYSRFPSSSVTVGAVTANQGAPNSNGNGWPVKVTDGTNVSGVAPANNAAALNQPALVVALSPNTPTPAGSNAIGSVSVSNFPGTQPVSGTFWQATQPVSAAALPLPSGASTSALQTSGNASLTTIATNTPALGQAAMAASVPVAIASNQSAVPANITQIGGSTLALGQAAAAASIPVVLASGVNVQIPAAPGRAQVALVYNAYSTTNVTNSAYTQLIAATGAVTNRIYISDTSGAGFYLATGGSGSEVNQLLIGPGGNDSPFELQIASGTRVSIKSVDTATVNTGALYMTLLT